MWEWFMSTWLMSLAVHEFVFWLAVLVIVLRIAGIPRR